ncbi:MAG: pyrroline-5-carboxylate reductase [Chloroflexi bacterium]|nr:pyrroline-5-carboxylate reductase [Chloroflexota bacterium]
MDFLQFSQQEGDIKLSFIGGGVMAEAIIRGVLDRDVARAEDIVVSDPVPARREALTSGYKINAVDDNVQAVMGADAVILAVKPQVMPKVLPELRGKIAPDQLLLSIAAGVGVKRLRDGLGHDVLIRAMPNTPAQVGQGITVWTATEKVSLEDRETGASILRALGEEIFVEDEKYLDMATALSGGGPAYVFFFIEALIDAGVHMGLSRDIAEKLVVETVLGSASLARQSGTHPAILKNMVTSPGGTTAEALLVMEEAGLKGTVIRAVLAAYSKAQSVGK